MHFVSKPITTYSKKRTRDFSYPTKCGRLRGKRRSSRKWSDKSVDKFSTRRLEPRAQDVDNERFVNVTSTGQLEWPEAVLAVENLLNMDTTKSNCTYLQEILWVSWYKCISVVRQNTTMLPCVTVKQLTI